MKTTVELNDALLAQARDLAHRERRTFRPVLEECSVGHGWLREEWADHSLDVGVEDARVRDFA